MTGDSESIATFKGEDDDEIRRILLYVHVPGRAQSGFFLWLFSDYQCHPPF